MKEVVFIPQRRTIEELQDALHKNHPDIEILDGVYQNYYSKFKLFHHSCNYIWETTANSIFRGSGCPKCGNAIRKTNEEFISELKEINPDIEVIGEYKGLLKKIRCHCLVCGGEWDGLPNNLLRGAGCAVCTGRAVNQGINDLNTIHPELTHYLVNKDDGFLYTSGSHKMIECECPDCHLKKFIEIKSLVTQGFACDRCSDHISYPNKFLRELLRQLKNDDYIVEYHPSWSKSYRYDAYFNEANKKYVVEMDGAFHYLNKGKWKVSGDTQRLIDQEKDTLAIENGCSIIRIDSRVSEKNYIKNNIMNSQFADVFDLSVIDWDKCEQFAIRNYTKDVCEFYDSNKYNMSMTDIMHHFNISKSTFSKYIQQGIEYGWCECTEYDRMMIRAKFYKHPKSKPIQVFQNGILISEYPSLNNCAKDMAIKYNMKFYGSSIATSIKRNNGMYQGFFFQYKDI